MRNCETLVAFMLANLKLASYDELLLKNLHKTRVSSFPVTTKQDQLFRKLVRVTYRRQFKLLHLNPDRLGDLEWKVPPVQSDENMTIPTICVSSDFEQVSVTAPYSKLFSSAIQSAKLFEEFSMFSWDRIQRKYIATFSLATVKAALEITHRYFDRVTYCDTLKAILPKERSSTVTVPTAHLVNDRLIICNTNEFLNSVLPTIEPTFDGAIQLRKLGVNVSTGFAENVASNQTELTMLTTRFAHVNCEQTEEVLNFLHKAKIKYVRNKVHFSCKNHDQVSEWVSPRERMFSQSSAILFSSSAKMSAERQTLHNYLFIVKFVDNS